MTVKHLIIPVRARIGDTVDFREEGRSIIEDGIVTGYLIEQDEVETVTRYRVRAQGMNYVVLEEDIIIWGE